MAGQYAPFRRGMTRVECRAVGPFVIPTSAAAPRKGATARPSAAARQTSENTMMNLSTFLEVLGVSFRPGPLVFSSTREVYGDVHRFEEYARPRPTSRSPRGGARYVASKNPPPGVSSTPMRSANGAESNPRVPLSRKRLRPLSDSTCSGWSASCRSSAAGRGETITVYGATRRC